jgi:hypothetical protein
VESDLCNLRSPARSCQLWKPKTIQSLAPWTGASQFLPSHKKIYYTAQHSTAQHRGSTRSTIPLTEKKIAKLEREKIHAWILQRVMKFCSLLCCHSCNSIALGLN